MFCQVGRLGRSFASRALSLLRSRRPGTYPNSGLQQRHLPATAGKPSSTRCVSGEGGPAQREVLPEFFLRGGGTATALPLVFGEVTGFGVEMLQQGGFWRQFGSHQTDWSGITQETAPLCRPNGRKGPEA